MPPKKSTDAEVAVASPKKGAVPAKASKSQHADPVAAPAAAAAASAASPVEAPAAGPLNRASERIVGLLAAIKPATIADAATAAQLARLQELRKAHTAARDTLRVMLDEQDAKRPAGGPNAVDPARRKQLLELDAQFAALRADNDAAHRLKTQIVLDQQRLQQGADRTTTLRLAADRMQTTARDARRAADAAAADAAALKKKRAVVVASGAATAAAAGRSATQIDAEIDTLTKKCDAAKAKSDHAIERQLDKELAVLRKIKKAFAADATEDERVAAAERHAAKLASAADQADVAIAKAVDERDTHVRDLEQLRADKNVNAAFDNVRRKLADIAAKMDANRAARRDATNAPLSAAAEAERAEGRALTDRVSKARKDKEDMERQMDELRASIPTAAVPFAADLRADVIGRSGAGVAQLQRDYGVAIEFDGDKALLVGGAADVEKAAASFKAHCAALMAARQRTEVTFAPDQAPGIIGTGGSKISAIQRSSGANIKVDSAAGKAVLIGTAEAIADAKRQIEEHLAQNCESAVPFPAGLRDIILGKGGETVRQLEKEPGIRRIRVDKDNCVVYAVGTVEAVTKVKEFYTQIVRDWGHAPVDVTIPDVMVPTVLGPRGQTISAIQTETGAILTLRRPDALASNREGQVTVKGRGGSAAAAAASMSPGSAPNPSGARNAPSILQIRGPAAAVEAAKRRVEELIKRDEVKVKVEPELFSFLSTAGPTIVDSGSTSSLPATPGSAPQPSESPITDAALATPTNKKLLTPLEQLRAAYGVDQVSLIRFERCVVICGKKDKVTAARMALERLLLRSGVTAVTVPFPPVMRFALLQKKRTAAGKSVLQDVRDAVIAEVAANTSPVAAAAAAAATASPGQSPATSTLTVEVGPRGTHELVVSGTNKAEVDAATTKVRALVAEWTATKIKTVPIEGGSAIIPAVLGRQGSNTTALQEKYNAEINIDRDKCTVSVFALDAKNLEACVAEIVAIPGVVKAAPVENLPTEAAN